MKGYNCILVVATSLVFPKLLNFGLNFAFSKRIRIFFHVKTTSFQTELFYFSATRTFCWCLSSRIISTFKISACWWSNYTGYPFIKRIDILNYWCDCLYYEMACLVIAWITIFVKWMATRKQTQLNLYYEYYLYYITKVGPLSLDQVKTGKRRD